MPDCTHCHKPRKPRQGAHGLCGRCDRHVRRTGELPPVERAVSRDLSESIEVRLSPLLLEHVRSGAESEGVKPSEWIRRACQERALRKAGAKMRDGG